MFEDNENTVPARGPAMSESTTLAEAETIVDAAARSMTQPIAGECLLCFVIRMLDDFGCDDTLRFARAYRDAVAPRATRLEWRLGSSGGYCDCEIFLNGWEVASRFWTPEREVERDGCAEVWDAEPPAVVPACLGVRRGSTQPCPVWDRRRGMW